MQGVDHRRSHRQRLHFTVKLLVNPYSSVGLLKHNMNLVSVDFQWMQGRHFLRHYKGKWRRYLSFL